MHENYGAVVRKKSASEAATVRRWFRRFGAALIGIGLLSAAALVNLRAQSQSTEDAVRGVLTAQQTAWNAGDVDAFMSGYQSSDATALPNSQPSGQG